MVVLGRQSELPSLRLAVGLTQTQFTRDEVLSDRMKASMQIVLLGICCMPGGTDDPLEELSILPLPDYSISSDNVTMCVVSSTPEGRIFLGGGDGHLYEIICNSSSGWRQRKIVKVRYTAELRQHIALTALITVRVKHSFSEFFF